MSACQCSKGGVCDCGLVQGFPVALDDGTISAETLKRWASSPRKIIAVPPEHRTVIPLERGTGFMVASAIVLGIAIGVLLAHAAVRSGWL